MENIIEHDNSWRDYWSNKKSGGHRYSDEAFLCKEAKEKLFHLDGGKSLLDFGCGSADLLKYYIPHYDIIIGADFSQSMLDEAKTNIDRLYGGELAILQNINAEFQSDRISGESKRVYLVLSNEETVWTAIVSGIDRITASQVLQYLSIEQMDNFLLGASNKLSKNGKIVLFDIIHPNEYILFKFGFFSNGVSIYNILKYIGYKVIGVCRQIIGRPKDILGNSFSPELIESIANKYEFRTEFVQSMYYEYRYHAILTKRSSQKTGEPSVPPD
jgi:cyclopropane-fatty-acyl-phospholipid synthase